jgi:hypothetical protein
MAGAGYKLFATGDVLTASDVNTYLMQQTVMVFNDAAARTTALSGVVAEGMLSYLKDTNAVEVYNGSSWVASDDPNAIQNTIVDAKGDLISATASDTPARLAVGTDNQRLIAASGEATGLKYVSDTQNTVIDAEGDLLVGDAADTLQRLAVGTDNQILTVDTSVDGKIKWASPASAGGMTLLSTTSLSGATTTVSIGSGYTDLAVIVNDVTNDTANGVFRMAINGDSTNVFTIGIFSNGAGQNFYPNQNIRWQTQGSTLRTNADNAFYWLIKDYESSTNYKNIIGSDVYLNSFSEQFSEIYGGAYKSNTAITSLVFSNAGGNLSGGTVRVYGVK